LRGGLEWPVVHRSLAELRLSQVNSRLRRARQELREVEEELAFFEEAAEEARIRALVSETPLAVRELEEARRHAEAMERSRRRLLHTISSLEVDQDRLLHRLVPGSG
jgi:hypothetical protein